MKNVSILDFGAAVSDRVQTAAIQNAIDACFLAGGGRVVIPCGVFLTGAVRLRSRVELYLESGAVLRGSRDPADYDSFRSDLLEPLPGKVPPGTARSADPLSRWSKKRTTKSRIISWTSPSPARRAPISGAPTYTTRKERRTTAARTDSPSGTAGASGFPATPFWIPPTGATRFSAVRT